MRSVLFIAFLLIICQTKVSAHAFYFAYAEVEYNELSQQLEVSLSGTTHDLQTAIEKEFHHKCNNWGKQNISAKDSSMLLKYINNHLRFRYGCALDSNAIDAYCSSEFHLEGIQFNLDGSFMCFLSSPMKTIYLNSLSAQFDFLMESFPEQQNKLTFLQRDKSQTLVFIKPQQSQAIKLEE